MVFTVRVQMPADRPSPTPPTTRRAFLGAASGGLAGLAWLGRLAALGGLAGCDIGRPEPAPSPTPDALLPFLAATVALVARYDAAINAEPSLSARLTPLRDDHRAHVQALAREIGIPQPSGSPSNPTGPSGSAAPPTLQGLITAEHDAQKDAEKACLEGPGYRAALLGSIAACRASHQEALR
jgi:hypothetical protein